MAKIRVVVLASGRGSDFESIAKAATAGEISEQVVAMITDNPQAKAVGIAANYGIESKIVDYGKYPDRAAFEAGLLEAIDSFTPDLVVLAGYMRIVRSKEILSKYRGKMINIHPSLLPKYPGAHAQRDAFEAGEKISGFTIHFVDESLDVGPIIYQEKVDISGCKSADEAADKILAREHSGLPKVVGMFARGRFEIRGREVAYIPNEAGEKS